MALDSELARRGLTQEQALAKKRHEIRMDVEETRALWRRRMKSIGFIVLSAVAFIASFLIIASVLSRPPRESKITSDFRAHRAAYEQLRRMLLDDKGVHLVADWGVLMNDSPISKMPPDGGMPIKRYQEYLALLKETGARSVGRWEDPPETKILVWASGFAADTRHVAVAWLDHEPSNTMISLDAFYRTPKPRIPAYIHIDGNWYIWADW